MKACIQTTESVIIILSLSSSNTVYQFPSGNLVNFTPPSEITGFQVIQYPKCKVGVDQLTESYAMCLISPSIPDLFYCHFISEAKSWILRHSAKLDSLELSEDSHSREVHNSADQLVKNLLNQLFESLLFLSLIHI